MVVIGLFVKAEFENVTDFRGSEGHHWCLDVSAPARDLAPPPPPPRPPPPPPLAFLGGPSPSREVTG